MYKNWETQSEVELYVFFCIFHAPVCLPVSLLSVDRYGITLCACVTFLIKPVTRACQST